MVDDVIPFSVSGIALLATYTTGGQIVDFVSMEAAVVKLDRRRLHTLRQCHHLHLVH